MKFLRGITLLVKALVVLVVFCLMTSVPAGMATKEAINQNLIKKEKTADDNAAPLVCPGAGLLISEFLANPAGGTDSPFEYVELRATRTINFATTPYSVVFTNNGNANANGWVAGGALTYAFNITTGTVNQGDVVYVGGSSMVPTGTKLRTINTGTTGGDGGIGNAATSGVLGNGGANADSIAVFDAAIGSVNSSTVPIDAIFFGGGIGTAVVTGGTQGYQLPVNDNYAGGKLQSTSFFAPDPGSDQTIVATGAFSLATCTFTTNRTWALGTLTDGTSSVTLFAPGAPTITENTASSFVNLPATIGGALSSVISDPTDPGLTLGIDFTLADPDTPVNSLNVTVSSSNAAVVPNANLNLTGSGATRNLKITPAGVGYSNITVTVSDGGQTGTYLINYAASAAPVTPGDIQFHTGKSDASTAIAVDASYMLVADDEDQTIRLYHRSNSGTPVNSFDFTASLGLTDINGGVPREVDIEASTRIGSRIYWLGSHSNSSSGASRPNRNRLFATDVSGAGAATTLTFVGRYDNLKTDLINWDTTNGHGLGANFFGLAFSAAVGVIPESPDGSGFNIEGLTIAPDGTTGYISFRAPISPASARTNALIVPVTNLQSLVTGNPTAGPAIFGTPIQLSLGGRGIRSIERNTAGQYLIIAGPSGAAGAAPNDFRMYTWTGNPAQAPVLNSVNLTALNTGGSFESIVEVPTPLGFADQFLVSTIEVLSDNGDTIYYNDGVAAKDLANNQHKKFRSDTLTLTVPTAAAVSVGGRVMTTSGRGLARAKVTMTDNQGQVRSTLTNFWGYFKFDEVETGQVYTFTVNAKRYEFEPRVVNVIDALDDLNFIPTNSP
jgi:hypothetical protein